ncbi:MAG: BlaI/MecI/CopY family transcriptional regulator [Bacteroidales bacterium]|nr:BlaI/MecI/CopY family transcriptional regulator [Bacteroidales bacterium]
MRTMKELTKAEEQVMQVLWQIKQGFAADIITNFPEPKPAYNTVLTVVRILEKKGFVSHETFGKANRYYPLVSKEQYSEEFMQHFVRNYFDNSFKSMVSFFTNNKDLSMEDLDEIRRMIDAVPNNSTNNKIK